MIIDFTVGNYRSFKDNQTLSMRATAITEFKDNVIEASDFRVLKSAVIYGANGSGKSNLIKALAIMKSLVLSSAKSSSEDRLEVEPFLLNEATENQGSVFELIFYIGKNQYRYGFDANDKEVNKEWLFQKQTDNNEESFLFLRIRNEISINEDLFKEGIGIEAKTRSNALFLSVVDQFNGQIAKEVIRYFNSIQIIQGIQTNNLGGLTVHRLKNKPELDSISKLLINSDLGIKDVRVIEEPFHIGLLPKEFPSDLKSEILADLKGKINLTPKTKHSKFDVNNTFVEDVEFDLQLHESEGTKKLFNLSGLLLEVLERGDVLIVDELDSSLHPKLSLSLLALFNSVVTNSKGAQLIFSTHDTVMLTYGQLRRDQINFIEKNNLGSSHCYSLVEYKAPEGKVRKDRSFEKDYINGRYGAIPFLGDFSKIFKNA